MLWDQPKCTICNKEIKEDEDVFVKIRYPKQKGFTEIKAYLRNNGNSFVKIVLKVNLTRFFCMNDFS
ncbi:Fe3+ hydroxamate ABC transporter substrate-binding protein [Metabacillus litoralis]|uniref:Fe3+ hydroxamate ABC transporter substrate-binding protein n=1 Tax=Metabacillus litoralis TaxID=152268 RepID=UPI00308424BD